MHTISVFYYKALVSSFFAYTNKKESIVMGMLCSSTQPAFVQVLSIIEGKWKLKIIYALACGETLRYGQLKKDVCGEITHKMLSSQLKELERDGMIARQEYPQIPPKVEYSLSEKGCRFIPILDEIISFGEEFLIETD